MPDITLTEKQVKQFCTGDVEVREALDAYGEKMYIKLIRINKIDQLGISQTLEFNRYILGDVEAMIFPQHFLKIEEEMNSSTVTGFLTKPYQTSLELYLRSKRMNEKEAMTIFDQIVKAVYSLYVQGYATRNLRPQHFVLCNKVWKIQSLIYTHEYKQAQGSQSQYLWNPKYQAPECFNKSVYLDDDFNPILVWNMGCILLEMLLGNHRFPTKDSMDKIKNSHFTFQALGLNPKIWGVFSAQVQQVLAHMLHYDPKKRMTLLQVFQNDFISYEVSKHYKQFRPNSHSKIAYGKSSVRTNKLSQSNRDILERFSMDMGNKEAVLKNTLRHSKLNDIVADDEFMDQLKEFSVRIPSKKENGSSASIPLRVQPQNNHVQSSKGSKASKIQQVNEQKIQELMHQDSQKIIKALELYKSYLDQSQLLVQAEDVFNEIYFPQLTPKQTTQLKNLIKFAVTLVSLINLNSLAQGFNQNRNILEIDGELYTNFSSSRHFEAFKKFVNFKRNQRAETLQSIRSELKYMKQKSMVTNNAYIGQMLKVDYKTTNFQQIKVAYRYIVKHAYDRISELYNEQKKTPKAEQLAKTAMYVTYCLTTDKLYIKEDIPDNFRFYFQWAKKSPSNYVPLVQFKRYLENAPKKMLIDNSRYILKKYYDI